MLVYFLIKFNFKKFSEIPWRIKPHLFISFLLKMSFHDNPYHLNHALLKEGTEINHQCFIYLFHLSIIGCTLAPFRIYTQILTLDLNFFYSFTRNVAEMHGISLIDLRYFTRSRHTFKKKYVTRCI